MPKHKYRTQREYRAQKQQRWEERRTALRERLEREFTGMGIEVLDLSAFDQQMRYEFRVEDDCGIGWEFAWLEMDFYCCGMGIFDQDVYSAKKKMGLADEQC